MTAPRTADPRDRFDARQPRSYPPRQLLAQYVPDLVELLAAVDAAERRRADAVTAWRALRPGGATFRRTLDEDRAAVVAYIAEHGEPPNPEASPLRRLLVDDEPTGWVAAAHAEAIADATAAQVDALVRAHRDAVVAALDLDLDELRDRIAEGLLVARDRKDQLSYLSAVDLVAGWRELNTLRGWLTSPGGTSYRGATARSTMPAELAVLEHEAYNNTHPATQREMLPTLDEHVTAFEDRNPRYRNATYPARARRMIEANR